MNGATVANGSLSLYSLVTGGTDGTTQSGSTNGQYVSFPGNLMANTASGATIEFWGAFGDFAPTSSGTWSRVFDFGMRKADGTGENYIYFTPHTGTPITRLGFRVNGSEIDADYPAALDNGDSHHVACVFDTTGQYLELYVDGVQASRTVCSFQLTNIATNDMWIGRSQWTGDDYLYGSLDEFRIYNRPISGAEVAADFANGSAGAPTTAAALTALGSISTVNLGDPFHILEKAKTNVIATGVFSVITNSVQIYNLPGFTLTSDNTNVFSVNASGAAIAVAPGTAHLTATYGSKTATILVTVDADNTGPVVTGVNPAGYDRYLQVTFNKPLDLASAQLVANYLIDGNAIVAKAVLNTNGNTVVSLFFTTNITATDFHTLVVSGVTDTDASHNVVQANSFSFYPAAGSALDELLFYTGDGYVGGNTGANADGTLKGFGIDGTTPDYPNGGAKTKHKALSNGLQDTGNNGDNYTSVVNGYLLPPVDGTYNFAVAADDDSAIYVGTDDTEASLPSTYTASGYGWCNSGDFISGESYVRTFGGVPMLAGHKYYFRFEHDNGTGGDASEATWQVPGAAAIANGNAQLGAAYLANPNYLPVPMTITGISDVSTYANQDVTFTPTITSLPTYTGIQWYSNNVAISNANGATWTWVLPQGSANGAKIFLVASNLVDVVTSAVSTVTITVDNIPPTLLGAVASPGNQVILTFSERINTNTGKVTGNYSIPGVTVSSAVVQANQTTVILTTSAQTPGTVYVVTVTGVKDLAGNLIASASANFDSLGRMDGFSYEKYWNGYQDSSAAGADAAYAYTVANPTPSGAWLVPGYISSRNAISGGTSWTMMSSDHYCAIAEGYITAPETGTYTFHITSDDASRLYLGTNETVSSLSATPVGYVNGYSGSAVDWANANNTGGYATLTAGQRYYYRVVQVEGTGGDGFNVGWEVPSNLGTITEVPTNCFGVYYDPLLSVVTLSNSPVSVTTQVTDQATFFVVAGGSSTFGSSITYQWMSNGIAIDGATSSFYDTPSLQSAVTAQITCVVSVAGKTVTTAPATLTVLDTPPTIVSAGALATDGTKVGVLFNKLIDPTTATNSTYTLSGGYVVTAAEFRTSAAPCEPTNTGSLVVLTVDPPMTTTPATVTVTGVQDLFGKSTNTSATISIVPDMTVALVGTGLGTATADPIFAGSTVATGSNSFQLISGGSDIWNNADGCQFVYKQVAADFDIRARVADSRYDSEWSKVGIMVRESLDGASRTADLVVDPWTTSIGTGANVWEPNYRAVTAGGSAGWPGASGAGIQPSYPHAWVRITGVGNVYTSFLSFDGVHWTQLAQLDETATPYAAQYVGICETAHNNDGTFTQSDIFDFSLVETTPPSSVSLKVSYDGTSVTVSWITADGAGATLYSSDDLKTWGASGLTVNQNGDTSYVTITPGSKKFYSLWK